MKGGRERTQRRKEEVWKGETNIVDDMKVMRDEIEKEWKDKCPIR